MASGCAPFRVPLLVTTTRGRSAWARNSALTFPWRPATKRSTVPRRFVGHIRQFELMCPTNRLGTVNQKVDGAETIRRAHQLELSVQRPVPEVDRPEFSERNKASERLIIFGQVDTLLRGKVRTIWIRYGFALEGCLKDLHGRRHNTPIHTGDRNLIAGFRHRMFRL